MTNNRLLELSNGKAAERIDVMRLATECLAWRNMLPTMNEYLTTLDPVRKSYLYKVLLVQLGTATNQIKSEIQVDRSGD